MGDTPNLFESFAVMADDGTHGPYTTREEAREAMCQDVLETDTGDSERQALVKCLDQLIFDEESGKWKKWPFPTIVCLCGSTRFMEAWQKANLEETLAGRIVLSIGCNTKSDADLQRMGELSAEKKIELDELHKRKIDLADEVLILNVDGYIGASTRSELEYAREHFKTVRFLQPEKSE
jgi:hypothetical protein